MGLNSVRDEFNIHYFDNFVPFKPDEIKKMLHFTTNNLRLAKTQTRAIKLCKTSQLAEFYSDQRDTKFECWIRCKSQRTITERPTSKARPRIRHKGVLGGQTKTRRY